MRDELLEREAVAVANEKIERSRNPQGSYWMTPTMRFAPQTSIAGSSSILAPRLIVPISRYVPPLRSISMPSGMT